MLRALSVLALVIASPSAAQAVPRPFDFKGFVAGQTVDADLLKRCKRTEVEIECTNLDDEIGGRSALTLISFYEMKLSSVVALLPRNAFPTVLAAVTAKYGEPCRTEPGTWRNASGASLDNPTFVWCFTSGELELQEIGAQLRDMRFVYNDENRPRPPAPTVDF